MPNFVEGRYVYEQIWNEMPHHNLQYALNEGSSKSWEIVSFVLDVKNDHFVIIWDKRPKS